MHTRKPNEHPFDRENLVQVQVCDDGIYIQRIRNGLALDGIWLDEYEGQQLFTMLARFEDYEHFTSTRG